MIVIFIVGTIGLVVLIGFIFINLSPQFGGKANEAQKKVYSKSKHFEKGIFANEIPTSMDMSFTQGLGILKKFTTLGTSRESYLGADLWIISKRVDLKKGFEGSRSPGFE